MVVNEGSCSEMERGKSYTRSTSRDNNLSIWPLREVGGAMAEVNNRKPHKNLSASQSIFVIEQQCFSYPQIRCRAPCSWNEGYSELLCGCRTTACPYCSCSISSSPKLFCLLCCSLPMVQLSCSPTVALLQLKEKEKQKKDLGFLVKKWEHAEGKKEGSSLKDTNWASDELSRSVTPSLHLDLPSTKLHCSAQHKHAKSQALFIT